MKIEIKDLVGKVLFVHETKAKTSTKIALEQAVKTGANLEGAYLEGANLGRAYLVGANLAGANLGGVNLRGANLEGAYLGVAYLKGANLEGANLGVAYLKGANLEGANLGVAYLKGANLEGANLEGANLEGAYLEGANLVGANLAGANLGVAYLKGANLAGANLGVAYLKGANLEGANLEGANLEGANLIGANIGHNVITITDYINVNGFLQKIKDPKKMDDSAIMALDNTIKKLRDEKIAKDKDLNAVNNPKFLNKEETKMSDIKGKMSDQKLTEMFMDATGKAATRSGVTLGIEGLKIGFSKLLAHEGVDASGAEAVMKFLNSPLGEGLLRVSLGFMVPYLPIDMVKTNEIIQTSAEEARISGMSMCMDKGLSMFKEFLMPALLAAYQANPILVTQTKQRVGVGSPTRVTIPDLMSQEEEPDKVDQAKAAK